MATLAEIRPELDKKLQSGEIDQARYDETISAFNKTAKPTPSNNSVVTNPQENLDKAKSSNLITQEMYDKATELNKKNISTIQQPTETINKPEMISDNDAKPKTEQKAPENVNVPDYLDDSTERQKEITMNLYDAYNDTPSIFNDYNNFKTYFDYNKRSATQKETLNNFWNSKLSTKTDMYSTMNANDIAESIVNGDMSMDDISQLSQSDPTRYNEIVDKVSKTTIYEDANKSITWNDINTLIDLVKQSQPKTLDLATEYDKLVNTDEIKSNQTELADKYWEIEELQNTIDNIEEDYKKQFPNATSWVLAKRIADATASLERQKNSKITAYNTLANKTNTLISSWEAKYKALQDQYDMDRQQRQDNMTNLGFAMQLMSYETPAQQDERAWNNYIREIEYTEWNINSSDPATRKKAVSNAVDTVLKEFEWIPMLRSREEMVSDIQWLVDGGMSLWDAITENIRKPIMWKKEYQVWASNKLWIDYNSNITIWNSPYTFGENWQLIPVVSFENMTGADLTKALASGTYNGNKFFKGAYASGDKDGTFRQWIYNTIEKEWLESYYNRVTKWNAPVTLDMIYQSSQETGVPAEIIATFLQADSKFWMSGIGSKNNNPWNVGQFDRFWTDAVEWYATMQEWVTAAAKNLQSRMNALQWVAWWTTTGWKDELSSKMKLIEAGMLNKSDIPWVLEEATKAWRLEEFNTALNQWATAYMTDTQRAQRNASKDDFKWDAVVKWFEEWMTQYQNLAYALSDKSWPWDMAAVFTFMKTMDPTSVVRESEFDSAAASAGKIEQSKNIFNRLSKWKILTESQSEAFRSIATEFIKNKAVSYNRLYDNMIREFEYFNIDKSLRPTNATEQLFDFIEWNTQDKGTTTNNTEEKTEDNLYWYLFTI